MAELPTPMLMRPMDRQRYDRLPALPAKPTFMQREAEFYAKVNLTAYFNIIEMILPTDVAAQELPPVPPAVASLDMSQMRNSGRDIFGCSGAKVAGATSFYSSSPQPAERGNAKAAAEAASSSTKYAGAAPANAS